MQFVLFDIDGTLIDSGGCGVRALNAAFEEICSIPHAFGTISMAGKTDMQIVSEGLRLQGLDSSNGVVPAVLDSYVRHLGNTIDPEKGHVKPGIREALENLHDRDDMVLGLLTGNIEAGALIKLQAFELAGYFATGAYGSDDADRNRLLPIAREKLKKSRSLDIAYRDCIVIGDTPRDVACAKPYGAFSIAVATGPYSYEALVATAADRVFCDLSDTAGFLHALRRQKY